MTRTPGYVSFGLAAVLVAEVLEGQTPSDIVRHSAAVTLPAGITLMASPKNFRQSWWHNRDYGLMVANPFGRAALTQGERSTVTVKRGEDFRLVFGAALHNGDKAAAAKALGMSRATIYRKIREFGIVF